MVRVTWVVKGVGTETIRDFGNATSHEVVKVE